MHCDPGCDPSHWVTGNVRSVTVPSLLTDPAVNATAIAALGTAGASTLRCPFRFWFLNCFLLTLVSAASAGEPPPRKYTNIERLSLTRLAAVHNDVQKLNAERRSIPP